MASPGAVGYHRDVFQGLCSGIGDGHITDMGWAGDTPDQKRWDQLVPQHSTASLNRGGLGLHGDPLTPPLPSRLCTVPCYGLGTGLWAKAGGAGRKEHIRTPPGPPATSAPPQSPSSPAPPPRQGLPHCCLPVMAQALPPAHNSSPCVPASCCRSPSRSWCRF